MLRTATPHSAPSSPPLAGGNRTVALSSGSCPPAKGGKGGLKQENDKTNPIYSKSFISNHLSIKSPFPRHESQSKNVKTNPILPPPCLRASALPYGEILFFQQEYVQKNPATRNTKSAKNPKTIPGQFLAIFALSCGFGCGAFGFGCGCSAHSRLFALFAVFNSLGCGFAALGAFVSFVDPIFFLTSSIYYFYTL